MKDKNKFVVLCVIGARPQFIKHAALQRISQVGTIEFQTVHTGQHFDDNMSKVFFDELGIAKPTYFLDYSHQDHQPIGVEIMTDELAELMRVISPDAVLVYGDTTSTLAGALAAHKLALPIFHVEAGLRSNNLSMPEEENRIKTDHLSTLLFAPNENAKENLLQEGIMAESIHNVGDIMKDVLLQSVDNVPQIIHKIFHYVTLHRPYNVDNAKRIKYILDTLNRLNEKIVLAIHPRTQKRLSDFNISIYEFNNIEIISPQSYINNLSYMKTCLSLITDSGGMQKEAYWLRKPCITIRSETEWPETLENGCNLLVFEELSNLQKELHREIGEFDDGLYGNGRAAEQIVTVIQQYFNARSW